MKLYYVFDEERYDYEIEEEDVSEALSEILAEQYKQNGTKEQLKTTINGILKTLKDSDLLISFAENYQEEIENFFLAEAKDGYRDQKDFHDNPYRYFGVREKDFH